MPSPNTRHPKNDLWLQGCFSRNLMGSYALHSRLGQIGLCISNTSGTIESHTNIHTLVIIIITTTTTTTTIIIIIIIFKNYRDVLRQAKQHIQYITFNLMFKIKYSIIYKTATPATYHTS